MLRLKRCQGTECGYDDELYVCVKLRGKIGSILEPRFGLVGKAMNIVGLVRHLRQVRKQGFVLVTRR